MKVPTLIRPLLACLTLTLAMVLCLPGRVSAQAEDDIEPVDKFAFYSMAFTGPENFLKACGDKKRQAEMATLFKDSTNPDLDKIVLTNRLFYLDMTGEEASEQWPLQRKMYAVEFLGAKLTEKVDDERFYRLAGARIKGFKSFKDFDRLRRKQPPAAEISAEDDARAPSPGSDKPAEADAAARQAAIMELELRTDDLEKIVAALLADPEIQKKYSIRRKVMDLAMDSDEKMPNLADYMDALVRLETAWDTKFLADPIGFEAKMRKASARDQKIWEILKAERAKAKKE
jgi:hypothetical protein